MLIFKSTTGRPMAPKRHKMNQRVLQDLKIRSGFGIFIYVVLSFVVVIAEDFYTRHTTFSIIFLAVNSCVCLFRAIHLVVSGKVEDNYLTLSKAFFFSVVMMTALTWGIALALVMRMEGELATQMLMIVCICGLCAGGVVAYIPNRWLSFSFNFAMTIPTFTTLLIYGLNPFLAVMIFLYATYMVSIAYRGNREYWKSLENELLLEIRSLEMERLSITDALTGLYNRRHFDEVLDREWKRSGRDKHTLSLILLDIDQFKIINDTYGHQAGDDYLRKTAALMISIFKRDHDTVARYGGEEFIVLLPGLDADQAFLLAERVRQEVESLTIDHQETKVRTTISAGIMSCIPDFQSRSDSIISGADKALYSAKQKGRNNVVIFTPAMADNHAQRP
jgi:diguanylate cyclase (GGDEF)-like protein